MLIRAVAPWYGSKRTLAPRIVSELGPHKFYVEPFCGSLAVLLAKPPVAMETANDLHGDLINLARVLANETAAEALYKAASRLLMHEQLHGEFKAECVSGPETVAPSVREVAMVHVDRALAYLCMSWMGRNGSAGTRPGNITTARRFTSNGGSGGLRWRSAVDSIPAWHERLRAVSISRMDAFELLERLGDQAGTAVYVDPPYLRKTDKYIHDLAAGDHERLAKVLGRFKAARVVVSYYDEPELRELYKDWTWVECPVTKGLANQGRRDAADGAVAAPEVLILNGPSVTGGGLW
jgi:DNA adenine methylase